MRCAASLAAVAVILSACDAIGPRVAPFGFMRSSARAQLALEKRFLAEPDAERIRQLHRELTRKPHPAGSPRDRELAEWTAKHFADAGMQDVQIVTHEVMLPRPIEVSVEIIGPPSWRAPMRETPVADPDTHLAATVEAMAFHAYSASGDVTAPVVFAGDGNPAAYRHLVAKGIDVRGKIVLVRQPDPSAYVYRGYKAFIAQGHGAAGILMFSDPQRPPDGGKAYPDGPWGPDSLIERGGIIYDFFVPGDPLTPGWASIPGARRIARTDAVSLPRIISAPLSAQDARRMIELLGVSATPFLRTGGTQDHRAGPSKVRMKVRMDDSVRPVWTVTGFFRGAELPDEIVILGNHRDAWLYGGVDPSSGSAALIELASAFGALIRNGWKPRRSILFASWDAEEFAVTSSTEWVEQHQEWLRDRAVAYLNVDSGVSGSRLAAGAVPSLSRLIREAADAVQDPVARTSLGTVLRDRVRTERSLAGAAEDYQLIDDRLGGGSDYIPFLNFLGIPVADLAFEGPYGVYHSIYDTHQWVSRFGDPGFRYHSALVQLWGVAALRLANADVLPLDPEAAAGRIVNYVDDAIARAAGIADLPDLREVKNAAIQLKNAAS